MAKAQYVVICIIAGELSYYKETGLGLFRVFTGRREEAARLTYEQTLRLADDRTFAVNDSHLDKWLADPPRAVAEIIARQKASVMKNRKVTVSP